MSGAPPRPITVAVVHHQRLILEALRSTLEQSGEIQVVAIALDGIEGRERILDRMPQVAVLTAGIRGILEVAAELFRARSTTRTLFLAGPTTSDPFPHALAPEAGGIIPLSGSMNELCAAIRAVARGERWESAGQDLKNEAAVPPASRRLRFDVTHPSQLSARQIEVLRHLARGLSVKEVARQLGLSAKSIEGHKYRIMQILNIHDRVELSLHAVRTGLVDV